MKIYLSKGNGMSADLTLSPYKMQLLVSDEHVPDEIKTYTLRILGAADESVDINGSLLVLEETVCMMAEVMKVKNGSK